MKASYLQLLNHNQNVPKNITNDIHLALYISVSFPNTQTNDKIETKPNESSLLPGRSLQP